MITISSRGKQWKNASDEEKISYCDGLLDSDKQSRQQRDFEWYMNYRFLEGDHYVYYNSVTNALERPPRQEGEVRAVINKTRSVIRSIRNYTTRYEPKWEIIPGDIDLDTIVNARRSGKVLDYIYRKLHLEGVIGGVTDSILNTSVAWVERDWDENAEGGTGEIKIKLHDTFDVWVPTGARLDCGRLTSHHVIKTIRRSLDEIESDKRYSKAKKDVKSDDDLAVSEMKKRILRREYGHIDDDKVKKATVKEFMIWDDEENEKGGNLQLFTYAGGQILRDEPLKETAYPIYCCQVQLEPRKIYQRSWTADAVPLNKILNRTFSQKVMYVNQALVFRIIAEKGHGATPVPLSNNMGEVVEINKNRKFQQWTMAGLPSDLDSLNIQAGAYIEDTLGAHEAALGALPAGARSGKTLEALQAADSNNLSGLRQALESFLSVLGKAILELASEKYVASRVVKISEPEMDEDGNPIEYLTVTGKVAPAKKKGSVIITGEDEVIVKIGSWLGYTLEAQRETLMGLAKLGIIPADEVMRQFEFPNVEELSKKAKAQRMENHILQAEIAGRNQGGQQNQGGGVNADQMKAMADKENTQMANGQPLPPTEGADMNMTQAHMDFMKTRLFTQLPPEIQQIVQAHAQGELQAQGIGG